MQNNIQKIVVTFLLMISSTAIADEQACPFPEKYLEIDRAYHQCANGQVRKGESCELFVKSIVTLFPKYNCMRSFDTEPVPALWLFDAASEDYIKLLYEMASGKNKMFNDMRFSNETFIAKEIFLSQEFREVLDGHIAEKYYPLIEKVKESAP